MRLGALAIAFIGALLSTESVAATITYSFHPDKTTNSFTITGCCVEIPHLTQLSISGAPPGALVENETNTIYAAAGSGGKYATIDSSGNLDWSGSANMIFDSYGRFYDVIRLNIDFKHPTFTIVSYSVSGSDDFMRVPEPATWFLMIAGFIFVGSAIRRRGARRESGLDLAMYSDAAATTNV